jgi:hypothetical protein
MKIKKEAIKKLLLFLDYFNAALNKLLLSKRMLSFYENIINY